MAVTISLQNITSDSGYFSINIRVKNTASTTLSGVRLRPIFISLPDGSVVQDPAFGTPSNAAYDPLVENSWTLPSIAAGATYVQTSLLPVISSLYQSTSQHVCQFYVVQEGVAILSNLLNVPLTPLSEVAFSDPLVASVHNNIDNLDYSALVSTTSYATFYSSTLDSSNIPSTGTVKLVSTSTSDTQLYRIVGLDGSGNAISERGLLTGQTTVMSRNIYSYIFDFYIGSPAIGTVTLSQASTTYATIPPNSSRTRGFRFADTRPHLIHKMEVSSDTGIATYVKLTTQGFGSNVTTESPIYENVFLGGANITYFYPPLYVAPNSIVRGYTKLDGGSVTVYGVLSTGSISGF